MGNGMPKLVKKPGHLFDVHELPESGDCKLDSPAKANEEKKKRLKLSPDENEQFVQTGD